MPLRDTAISTRCPANSTTASFDPGPSGSTSTISIARVLAPPPTSGTPIWTRFHSHRLPHALPPPSGSRLSRRRIYSNIILSFQTLHPPAPAPPLRRPDCPHTRPPPH